MVEEEAEDEEEGDMFGGEVGDEEGVATLIPVAVSASLSRGRGQSVEVKPGRGGKEVPWVVGWTIE
jgi:hypothetical protein